MDACSGIQDWSHRCKYVLASQTRQLTGTVQVVVSLRPRPRMGIWNQVGRLRLRGMALLTCRKPVPAASICPRALSVRILEKRHSLATWSAVS